MGTISVGHENSQSIDLHYEDRGDGPPIVLVHGWAIASGIWDRQVPALLDAGYRVVTYDRRGCGRSTQTSLGRDVDTYAEDLAHLLSVLNLHDVTLVGFSSGAFDIVRFLGTYGADLARAAVLVGAPPPDTQATPHWPQPGAADVRVKDAVLVDRPGYLKTWVRKALAGGAAVGESTVQALWQLAVSSTTTASLLDALQAMPADVDDDLKRIAIPLLLIHGGADALMPAVSCAQLTRDRVPDVRVRLIDGAPHALLWTHHEQVNDEVLDLLRALS